MELSLEGSPRINPTCHLCERATFQPVKSDSNASLGRSISAHHQPSLLPFRVRRKELYLEAQASLNRGSQSQPIFPFSPEFLTLLAPVTDDETQPEEDQPQHKAPNTTQHLALGRSRLCP